MLKRTVFCLAICAMAAATVAEAQGRHGRGGGGGGHSASTSSPEPPPPPDQPLSKAEIVGVVRAIDPQNDRVTIDYEPVEILNWPRGSMPFVVSKSALLQGVSVGEKVRFKLEGQQISELKPFLAASAAAPSVQPSK